MKALKKWFGEESDYTDNSSESSEEENETWEDKGQ